MTRQLKWGLGVLVLIIMGFVALQIFLYIDMKNFKERIADSPKVETQTPNIVFSEEKPVDVPGFKWVRHGNHWDKVPIDAPFQPIEHPPEQVTEVSNPQQKIEPVVIDGVGDLKEWLAYFESFGDDPSLAELYERKFGEKRIQYGVSMRTFDYKNASPEVLELLDVINEKNTALGYIKSAKRAAAQAKHEE